MAIQFARIEIVSRSEGKNACLKAAYNARLIIKDERTNITYNFSTKGDNVYHAVLLPSHVDQKFKNPSILMNEVERSEKRKNSQLLKDVVIALPDDKELDLNDRIAITHEIIEEMGWVKNGLGVQVDIHQPQTYEKNWHAHVLVTTRRFAKDGKTLGAKAVDLNPKFARVKGKAFIISEDQIIHERAKEVINKYFAKLGLEIRVDPISFSPEQHVGPTRMRSIINEIAEQNKICKLAHLEIVKNSDGVLNRIIRHQAIFTKLDIGKEIEFNPQDVSFKHGYASTVYKAQGASIKDVYVLHNLAGNSRNSYVAMTRHIEEVKLYYNRKATRNMTSLISQLSKIDNRLSSINLKTLEELVAIQDQENKSPNIIDKVGDWFKGVVEDIKDRLHSNDNYYHLRISSRPPAKVAEILRSTSTNLTASHKAQEERKSSSYNLKNCNKQDTTISVKLQEDIMAKNKIDYNSINKQKALELKQKLSFKAEEIGRSLLGSPNKHLSNSQLLRWEKDGKIVMKIHGSKAGIWYDFSKGEGGDLFTLVQREKNCDFVEAKKYLQNMVGVSTNSKDLAANKNQQIKTQTEQEAETVKIKRAIGLYEKSDSVKYVMPNNVAKRYLSEHRGIKEVLTRYQLSFDLRTDMMWDSNSKQYYPALIVFARNKDGNITGGQSIYLNKDTNNKADIEVNKRSFGRIRGSFVEINKNNEQQNVQSSKDGNNLASNVTVIAEVVETALSIAEAGIKGKILCSLGISNIRNYEPIKGERIIIAADNDGKEAVSVNTVIKAQEELISKGATVSIIRPPEKGDFNDMLKSQGAESIRNLLEPEIAKLTAASNVAELKSSLKTNDNRKSQIKSIELLCSKFANNDNNELNNLQQQQIIALAKFGTEENINTAIQIYREKGIDSCMLYSNKICIAAIEQKIQKDLQIMKNKFDPNYNLGDKKFSDIVIYDFQGKSHLIPEDYLNAIGKDKQVMQYVSPSSEIAQEIRSAVKQVSEIKLNQGIRV
ncbi:MobA/MobL family protein [Rickettsia hoogstraalii]|uniref:MobA/MobL family protein n=1 Tax=Rickettsia hoogstraalii TaxID=467174 RepID=UPI00058FAAEE|nr:MobA/MobL family protein [Rickettsia hoogstraalii]